MAKPDFSLLDNLDGPAPAPKASKPDFSLLDNLDEPAAPKVEPAKIGMSGPGSKDPDAGKVDLAPTAPKVGAAESFVRLAGAQVPFGRQAEAAYNSLPYVGTGKTYAENLSDQTTREAAAQQQHPIASDFGKGMGFGLSTLAGPVGAEAVLAKGAGAVGSKLISPGVSAVQGGLQAGSDSKAPTVTGKAMDALAGTIVGGAFGAGASTAGHIAGKVAGGASTRDGKRIVRKLEDGATIKLGSKLKEAEEDVIAVARKNPGLQRSPVERSEVADGLLTTHGERLDRIYATADKLDAPLSQSNVDDVFTQLATDARKAKDKPLAEAFESLRQKHLFDDPDAVWSSSQIRRMVTDLQTTAFDKGPAAAVTEVRKAAGDAASKLRSALEDHVDRASNTIKNIGKDGKQLATPEQIAMMAESGNELSLDTVRELNRESSALIRIKKAADYVSARDPGNRLAKIADYALQTTAAGMLTNEHTRDTGVGILAVRHGVPLTAKYADKAMMRFTKADDALAAVAGAARTGTVAKELVEAAIKAGVKASTIAAITSRLSGAE